jgi:hypothetical protein
MTGANINDLNPEAARGSGDAMPWQELRDVELALAQIVAERPGATVSEIADELARLEGSLADARGALEAVAGETHARRRDVQLARVVEALLPADVPPPAAVWHAQQSAQARLALLREWGAWSAGELAERAGSTAANRSALASAWRAAGRILGVEWNGRTIFPAFQFAADGQPRPEIASVLTQLRRAGLNDWQAALWFTSPTGWLDDRAPVELLEDDPDAVASAAAEFDQRPT